MQSETRSVTLCRGQAASVHAKKATSVVLLEGNVWLWGSPLERHQAVQLDRTGACFECLSATARLELSGSFTVDITNADSDAATLHALLQERRIAAASQQPSGAGRGPSVIVVGNADTGKSSLVSYLVNRALAPPSSAEQHQPSRVAGERAPREVFAASAAALPTAAATKPLAVAQVELDLGQPSMAVAGAVSALFLDEPVPAGNDHQGSVPLSIFVGTNTVEPAQRPRILDAWIALRRAIDTVREKDERYAAGGLVINTMGWTTGLGLDLIKEAIDVFRVTHIVYTETGNAVQDDVLAEEMQKTARAGARTISVYGYQGRPRVFRRKPQTRKQHRQDRFRSYFVGTSKVPLAPVRVSVKRSELCFLDAVTGRRVDDLLFPLQIAAVSSSKTEDAALNATVVGYVALLDIGEEVISMLVPAPGPLPSPVFLVSPRLALSPQDVPPLV